MMEVFLYNSTVCRLCGEENDNGTLLYTHEENNQNLSEIVNTYLPIKVSDDGQLPRTICPGCTIQLEATVEFFNLIINGQKIIRDLHQRENEYKKNVLNTVTESDVIAEKIVYEINTSDGVYHVEHPISLQVAGLEKPKRKRGRPSKKPKTPEELALEAAAAAAAKEQEAKNRAENKVNEDETSGKRRRKTPTRFREAVQGKELEKIFMEEGVIDKEDHDSVVKKEFAMKNKGVAKEAEIIGHVATSGEPVVIVKGKGRGRPKGAKHQPNKSQCPICGLEFWSEGRYMSHVAAHHPHRPLHKHRPLKPHLPHLQQNNGENCTTIDVEVETEQAETPQTFEEQQIPANNVDFKIQNNTTETSDTNVNSDGKIVGDTVPSDPLDVDSEETVEASGKKKLKCKYCDKLFSTRQSKSLHIKAVHFGERPYVCKECGATFPYPRSLALHALAHRRRRGRRGYACDLCGKILNHPSSVIYHKQSVHAMQRFVCGSCGKHFRHRQLLRRHQLVHTKDRPFRCKLCDSTFKTKANLCNHQLLHSGVKKYSCDICRHKFSHKTSLTLHMRWHTGMKPFSCKSCGKSFTQKGNLSEHERIHTGEKPFLCALCPRRFTTSSQHRLHARRHHSKLNRNMSATPETCDESTLSGEHIQLVIDNDHGHTDKGPKQMSLLVSDRVQSPALEVTLTPEQLRHLCGSPQPLQPLQLQPPQPLQLQPPQPLQLQPPQPLQLQPPQPLQLQPPQPLQPLQPLQLQPAGEADEDGDGDEVIYVAYDVDSADSPAFRIIDAHQAVSIDEDNVVSTCHLFPARSPLHVQHTPHEQQLQQEPQEPHVLNMQQVPHMQHVPQEQHLQLASPPHVQLHDIVQHHVEVNQEPQQHITIDDDDEVAGRAPIHFRMQDGTLLAVTSLDGETLQIVTQDGQTIPVEVNTFDGDVVETVTSSDSMDSLTLVEETAEPTDDFRSDNAHIAHYFTIV